MTPMSPPAPFGAPPPAPPAPGPRRTRVLVAGVVVLLAGLIASALLWNAASSRQDSAVRNFARAPLGCETTMDFSEAGSYLIYVELRGTLDDIPGTCGRTGGYASFEAPSGVEITVSNDDGVLDLPRQRGVDYDRSGFVGESLRSLTVEEPGSYLVTVEAPPGVSGFGVAIGRDPADGVGLLQNLAALAAIVGLVGGGILLVGGARREQPPVPAVPQWPAGPVAVSPPGMPQPPAPGGWQPAAGPPTTLRPPPPVPPPTGDFAPPSPASPAPPPSWQQPASSASPTPAPTPAPTDDASWAPQAPSAAHVEIDDSAWAPPED